jgi:glutamyl-Q tRNA(Asp) synthetase
MIEGFAERSCEQIVTRFAPSPTGLLHLGHAFAASAAWRAARQASGRFLLRLEDIDPQRCRPAYAAAALEDLAWLGFVSDAPVRVQSEHLPEYRAALEDLAARRLAYPCFCSRADIAREVAAAAAAPHPAEAHAPAPALYPGTCRHFPASLRAEKLAAGTPHAWRLDMQAALATAPNLRFYEQTEGWVTANPAPFGDVVLGRRDVPASYHLCVTHDDALQGVTLVTRAHDLKPATHLHVLLQHLMHWPTPTYAHHPLLTGPTGARLSKRDGAVPIRDLRAKGLPPDELLRQATGSL